MTDPRPGDSRPADVSSAPDPDSAAFLGSMNTVEQVSPETTADAPATDPGLIPTDPGTVSDG
jgi:hypothetical protein